MSIDLTHLFEYGFAGAALLITTYVIVYFTRQSGKGKTSTGNGSTSKELKELAKCIGELLSTRTTNDVKEIAETIGEIYASKTSKDYKEFTKAMDNIGQMVSRLCILIENQAAFSQRIMERLDKLWEQTFSQK